MPASSPVNVLNVAHSGLFSTWKLKVSPFGSLAVGLNEYAALGFAVDGAAPEIVGASLAGSPLAELAAALCVEASLDPPPPLQPDIALRVSINVHV
jgi:hypothetical protein